MIGARACRTMGGDPHGIASQLRAVLAQSFITVDDAVEALDLVMKQDIASAIGSPANAIAITVDAAIAHKSDPVAERDDWRTKVLEAGW